MISLAIACSAFYRFYGMQICFLLSWTVTEIFYNGQITAPSPVPFCNALCVCYVLI